MSGDLNWVMKGDSGGLTPTKSLFWDDCLFFFLMSYCCSALWFVEVSGLTVDEIWSIELRSPLFFAHDPITTPEPLVCFDCLPIES